MPLEDEPATPKTDGTSVPDVRATDLLPVDRWNQQAWPPITFGVPAGWTDVPSDHFSWLAEERRVPPTAPILQQTHILAAVQHAGSVGPQQVQLRLFDNRGFASYILENPIRWTAGRGSIGNLAGEPEHLRICGCPAVLLKYHCAGEPAFVFYEAWLVHPDKGYHFVGSAPAADEPTWRKAWDTMLENTQEHRGSPQTARSASAPLASAQAAMPSTLPIERYRCGVGAQIPVTLENVTSRSGGMFIIGSPSLAAWAMLGATAMTLWGKVKAAGMEGQTRLVPASGEAVLMNDRIVMRLVVPSEVSGVRLRGDAASRSVRLEIPYRLIRRCGTDQGGVYLEVVGRGIIRLNPGDRGDFAQWLAHLTFNKTWQQPSPLELRVDRPVVSWCQQDSRFTFGLPQRWVPADPGPLADYGRLFQPSALRAGVLLDAGEWEAQVFVIEHGPVRELLPQADTESLAALLVSATDIFAEGPPQIGTLGGETVALLRGTSTTSEGIFDRGYGAFAHSDVLYALWYGVVGGTVGDGSHERWLPDFHSMMATWHWYV
jgi:hypothetical protein